MVKTKQTASGGSSTRQQGVQVVTFSELPEADQFEDIDKEDWPDMENPQCQAAQQAVEQGEASKSRGKTGAGEGSQAVDKPTPKELKKEQRHLPQQHKPLL